MLDFSFSEIALIGVVALVVLGPEKMPAAVRTTALMIGRLKRTFTALKTEIEKEIGADDIRRQLRNEEIMERFKQTQNQIQDSIDSVKTSAEEFQKNVQMEADAVASLGSQSSATGNPEATPETPAAQTTVAIEGELSPVTTTVADSNAPAPTAPAADSTTKSPT